jgi:hypothetical protein
MNKETRTTPTGYEWNDCGVCVNPKHIPVMEENSCNMTIYVAQDEQGKWWTGYSYALALEGGACKPSYSENFKAYGSENDAILGEIDAILGEIEKDINCWGGKDRYASLIKALKILREKYVHPQLDLFG